jgi:hypothetical protein
MVVDGRSLIRPYVQAFLIGGELAMGVAEYNRYLLNQVQGCLEAPSAGFTLWNASNRYYMVSAALKPLLQGAFPFPAAAAGANPEGRAATSGTVPAGGLAPVLD